MGRVIGFVPTGKMKRARSRENTEERSLLSPIERRRPAFRIVYWFTFGLLATLTLATLIPMYWLFTSGLKTSLEIVQFPPTWIPGNPDWQNFSDTWSLLQFPQLLTNTLILVSGSWILQVLVSVTAAFSLSKLRPAFGNVVLALLLTTLLVPPVAYLVPQYLNVYDLPIIHANISDNYLGVLLPEAVNAFNLFLLKSFFDEIPDEIVNAARIDGAGAMGILTRIVLPMSTSVLAVVTIFTVMASWKDFLWPYVLLQSDFAKQPLMVNLYIEWQSTSLGISLNNLFAAFALAAVPPILLFVVFQRQIIRGIALTGLTG
jgi:multiple sugar transport system permease protein